MDKPRIDLSIVIPVYNELENIPVLTDRIISTIAKKFPAYEIIFIDDGSTDGSSLALDKLKSENPYIKVYHFTQNNGQTAAFAAGFSKAQGDLVLTMDADLQVDPADIDKLLPYMNEYDLACGIRANRNDGFVKKVSSLVGNGVRNWLTHENIKDTGCPLKLFKKEVVKSYYLFEGMHRFFPTLAKINGFKAIEVPVNHYPRKFGHTKYGISNRMLKGLKDALAVRWMQKRTIRYEFKEEDKS
jgi:dolichol-phosphate mannosyltransferase